MVFYSRCIRPCCQLFSDAEHGRRPQLYIHKMLHEFMNCCVASTGHRVTSCEVPLLKLQLEGSCNLQLEPEKTLGSHSRHFHVLFLLRNKYSSRYSVKKSTLLAWTNGFPFIRDCWRTRGSQETPHDWQHGILCTHSLTFTFLSQ